MDWETSAVMQEFVKIAKEKDLLKEAYPENPHQEDTKTIEEKRLPEAEEHIMEQAHPEAAYVAEARGDGGLVENELEQQRKTIEMVNKMPTGSLVGRYANAAQELVALAAKCDDLNHTDAADLLISTAQKLLEAAETESPLD